MIEIKNFAALDAAAKKALVALFKKDPKIFFWDLGKHDDIYSHFRIIKHYSSARHGRKFRWEVIDNNLFASGRYGCIYRSLYTLSINEQGELQVKTRKPGTLRLIKVQKIDKHDHLHLSRMLVESDAMEYSDILHGKPLIQVGDVIYMVMRELSGRPLWNVILENKLTIQDRYSLSVALARALDEQIHKKGYVHRDLSYNNVLVLHINGTFIVSIIDFGFIKLNDYDDSADKVGTPDFMGPECFIDKKTSIKSDIYSLGSLFRYLWGGVDLHATESNPYQKSLNPAYSYIFYSMKEAPSCYVGIRKLVIDMCNKDMEKRPDISSILLRLGQMANQLEAIPKLPNTLFTPASLIPKRDSSLLSLYKT